ncbi:fasciclin-2-like [Bradysia coprophila]|uniref:fasciclin-2-like n=1 Tax=Bradysia coprophila TaxID=38358 RepID=UPI00187DC8D2|nr:fasciclin-2-like [Bradysia coprophila]
MLLKLLLVFAGCKGVLCNAITAGPAESSYHERENNKPEIVNVDSVYEVEIGHNVEIDCLTEGNAVLYKWSKERQDIVNANRFTVFAENGTMRVISVEESDRGVYTCEASNSFGSSERQFTINVLVEPSIDEFANITIAENAEGILTCKAKGRPAPSITFSWYGIEFTEYGPFRDIILPTQVIDDEVGETIATLNFTRAVRLFYGEYGCLATNTIASVKQIAYVTIEYPPNFSYMEKPPPVYSYERRPVHLTCKATALPEATIVWYWNDKVISEPDDRFFEVIHSGKSESTLVVEPVDDSYYATYKCVASNKLGEAERIMELREAHPPEAIAEVLARSWSIDMINFEITAALTGTPAEFYKYQYKEDAELDWIDSVNFTRVAWPVTTVYVQGLKPNTKYDFRFYAENEMGASPFIAISHQTMCEYRYAEPQILNKISEDRAEGEAEFIESSYPDRFELIWEPIVEPCVETIYYSIEYCLALHSNWKSLSIYAGQCTWVSGITSNSYVIGNLTADTYYAIRLSGSFATTSYHFMRTARDPITGGDPRLKIYPTFSVQNIAAGTFFNFTCKSKAESATDLSWRDSFNNPINSESSDGLMYTEAVNDAELMLVIPFVKHAMFGTYYCASLVGSESIETFVKIETYALVGASDEFEYTLGFSGRSGYMSCSFHNDDNTTIDWMFENNPIEPSDRYEFRTETYGDFSPKYYFLLVHNLTDSDEGFYTCRQSANERRIYHEVLLMPQILNMEPEYSAVEGIDFSIDCPTLGKPAPNVQWFDQNGIDVTLNGRFSVNRFGQMEIRRIESSDEGSYTCEARSIGGVAEKTVQLKVEAKCS